MLSFNFSLDEKDYYTLQLAFQKERLKEPHRKKRWNLIFPLGLLIIILVVYWPHFQNDWMSTVTTFIPFIIILTVYIFIRTLLRGKNRINPITAVIIKQQVSKYFKNPDNAAVFESKEYTLSDKGINVISPSSQTNFKWESIKKLLQQKTIFFSLPILTKLLFSSEKNQSLCRTRNIFIFPCLISCRNRQEH